MITHPHTSSGSACTWTESATISNKMVKHLLKNADESFLALLSYRVTPLPWCGRFPAEFLMGRTICSTLPQTIANLVPQWSYLQEFRSANNTCTQGGDCRSTWGADWAPGAHGVQTGGPLKHMGCGLPPPSGCTRGEEWGSRMHMGLLFS